LFHSIINQFVFILLATYLGQSPALAHPPEGAAETTIVAQPAHQEINIEASAVTQAEATALQEPDRAEENSGLQLSECPHFKLQSKQSWSDWFTAQLVYGVGSWNYILSEVVVIISWLTVNSYIPERYRFDPAPYAALNLIFSFIQEYVGSLQIIAQNVTNAANETQASHHKEVILQSIKLTQLLIELNRQPTVSRQTLLEAVQQARNTLSGVVHEIDLRALEAEYSTNAPRPTFGDNFTSFLASHMRSWKYLGVLTCLFTGWTIGNGVASNSIDPYPFLYLNIGLSAWIAVQDSITIKLMSHRNKNSFERDKELYLQNIRNLLLLIRTVENTRDEK